ncbi:MAG: type 1 glutamine amidotransferase [Paracoccaceae bacterium]
MHIAILMANTDESDFAQRHPKDGEKFSRLLAPLRPDWQFTTIPVKDGVFPVDLARYDGFIVTGSPASVHDDDPWVARLMQVIRQIRAEDRPLFGACFGHQAIAKALGGKVEPNPGGWVFGLAETEMEGAPIRLYAAHVEQVTTLPPGAEALGGNDDCPLGAYRIGPRVLTTQYHPEMTPDFMAALVSEYAEKLPTEVAAQARASLARTAETARIAERIVRFFETA